MSRIISLLALALVAAAAAAPIAQANPSGAPRIDPLAVSYLQGQGYTPAQIKAWTVGSCSHQAKPAACFGPSRGANLDRPKVDPMAVSYLMGQGLTPSEVTSWTTGTCSRQSRPASCYAAFQHGRVQPLPAASVTSSGSFDWGDAGIGAGAAVGTLLLLGAMGAGLANRRRQAASV